MPCISIKVNITKSRRFVLKKWIFRPWNERQGDIALTTGRSFINFILFRYVHACILDKGKSLEIVRLQKETGKDGVVYKLKLNEENLKSIMLHPEVKDKPVVIVSVAGEFRTGKSFLLNIFLKYLECGVRIWRTPINYFFSNSYLCLIFVNMFYIC